MIEDRMITKPTDRRHYDHSRKIGNEGDVIKHPVLVKVVETLAKSQEKKPFVYAESHTGRPFYVLPESGEWKNGVGKLSANELLQRSGLVSTRKGEEDRSFPNLQPYVREGFLEPLRAGALYPGSSGLVFRLLWRLGVHFRFYLWERDEAACRDLMTGFPQWREIHICRGDGISGVRDLAAPSLVLLDPFDLKIDGKSVLKTLSILAERSAFLCWTPLVDAPGTEDHDAAESFREGTKPPKHGYVRVKWKDPRHGEFWGCQMTFPLRPNNLKAIVADTIREVLEIMREGWTIIDCAP